MIGTASSVINRKLSPRVIAAIDELESGGGERFESLEELFTEWQKWIDEDVLPQQPSADWRAELDEI